MSLIADIHYGARQVHRTLNGAKTALRQALESRPQASARVGRVRRVGRMLVFQLRVRLAERASGDPYLAVGRVFYVPTAALRHRTALPYGYNPTLRPAAVVPGDWDQGQGTIEGSPYWNEFREALQGLRPWAATTAFRAAMESAEAESAGWRRRIKIADAQRVFRGYEMLYESMRSAGCLPQRELARRRGRGYQPTNTDDISIAIGRDGELLLCQGGHRVETARALGVETVPVWVGLRHSEWWALRRRIVAHAAAHGGLVPEPLLHPDLDNIPFACDCRARFEMVAGALPTSGGVLLDATPRWGYFLHRFETLGFSCTAIAPAADDRYFLERLRVAGERQFAIAEDVESDVLPAEAPVAALLLLRDTGSWFSSASGREALATLLARTRPRHVFVEGDVLQGVAPPESDSSACADEAVRFCASAMARPQVELLDCVGARPICHVSERDESQGLLTHVTTPARASR